MYSVYSSQSDPVILNSMSPEASKFIQSKSRGCAGAWEASHCMSYCMVPLSLTICSYSVLFSSCLLFLLGVRWEVGDGGMQLYDLAVAFRAFNKGTSCSFVQKRTCCYLWSSLETLFKIGHFQAQLVAPAFISTWEAGGGRSLSLRLA